MKILSIETSCDDTALTIFEAKGGIQNATFKILSNNSNSQVKIHTEYGGVYPMLAKREHIKNLPILLEKTLKDSKISAKGGPAEGWKKSPVDAIAVTYGPGLEPSLWSGIVFAKELSQKWEVPLIPVNHMEGHVLSVFGKDKGKFKISKIKTPSLALLVSGGHTQLVLSKKWMEYEIIGESLDDAVGEAFDKVARMMDLPYPGGPHISKLAEALRLERKKANQASKGLRSAAGARIEQFSSKKIAYPEKLGLVFTLPRPMLHSKNLDFSFSGLKTAVLYLIKKIKEDKTSTKGGPAEGWKAQIALEFENAAIECLTHKTRKAVEEYGVKTIIVAGGVAANKHLRNEMSALGGSLPAGFGRRGASGGKKIKILFPTPLLSTDNSIMIGIAGYLNYIKNKKKVPKLDSIKATGSLRL